MSIQYFKTLHTTLNKRVLTHSIDMITLMGFGICPDFKSFAEHHKMEYRAGEKNQKNKYSEIFSYEGFGLKDKPTIDVQHCAFVKSSTAPKTIYDEVRDDWVRNPYYEPIISANYWTIRFNPNKHYEEPYFKDLQELLRKWSQDNPNCLFIKKIDYAIDIPDTMTKEVLVRTRKSSGRVEDTYYYGKSGRNGYLKNYDKTAELGIKDVPKENHICRLEYTFTSPFDKNIKFDRISLVKRDEPMDLSNIGQLALFLALKSEDPNDIDLIKGLRTERYNEIKNSNVCETLELSFEPLYELLDEYCDFFYCEVYHEECQDEDLLTQIDLQEFATMSPA